MHIHANNNLLLASIGAGREELSEIQAKRAAEVRKRLASASRLADDSDSEVLLGPAPRVEARDYEAEPQSGDEDSFGRLFSVKV
ncbi:hypothetical protein HDF16_003077 [Granulicella aggregans]|uniref:Uncharacterized protein n=1 Tax=Granulicella aggregans TaxID=474949 RepID=A0A7W7ZEQ4_9BACT|nr:hypothetical protein [Granulicella aggregans]MBB5058363.1 hypothetical protein [Granulicella aggregans]